MAVFKQAKMGMRRSVLPFLLALIFTAASLPARAAGEVNVYTDRQEVFLREFFRRFEKESGIKVNTLFAKSGLMERAQAEGARSPADIFIVTDIGRARRFVQNNLAAPRAAGDWANAVAKEFRDPEKKWIALTWRARIIYASAERVNKGEINSYHDLADDKWRGRICTRSGRHPYNISLFAHRIVEEGEAAAKQWLAALKNNLARRPAGNDRAQIRGILNGECDLAIANSYYYFKMLDAAKEKGDDDLLQQLRTEVRLIPTKNPNGNITALMFAAHSPNPANAEKLAAFLLSPPAQEFFAEINGEFPARDDVPAAARIQQAIGEVTWSGIPLSDIAAAQGRASKMVEEIGFDF